MIATEAILPERRLDEERRDEPIGQTSRPARTALARCLYRGLGFLFLALAVAGVILPGLPATPFALLAVWAFGRGSPEWAARMERDPRFGPLLRNWRERRAVPRKAKLLAVLSMAGSFALLAAGGAPTGVLIGVGLVLCGVATYLVTRPS